MSKNRVSLLLMALTTAMTMLIMGGGPSYAAHPDIPLYTYEEAAQQFGFPIMPVGLDAENKGFPYSPKATCGNCHNGTLYRADSPMMHMMQGGDGSAQFPITDAAGVPITEPLVSYADMNETTFHAQMDANALIDSGSSQAGKPWTQSLGMAGKW